MTVESRSKEYRCWSRIIERCHNEDHKDYDRYGGRGILVCDRWLWSYQNFLEDMGRAPTKDHTIERLNNEKGYKKSNCVWATRLQQANNRRSSKFIEHRGRRMTMADWARHCGVSRKVIWKRLAMGWDYDRVFAPATEGTADEFPLAA